MEGEGEEQTKRGWVGDNFLFEGCFWNVCPCFFLDDVEGRFDVKVMGDRHNTVFSRTRRRIKSFVMSLQSNSTLQYNSKERRSRVVRMRRAYKAISFLRSRGGAQDRIDKTVSAQVKILF